MQNCSGCLYGRACHCWLPLTGTVYPLLQQHATVGEPFLNVCPKAIARCCAIMPWLDKSMLWLHARPGDAMTIRFALMPTIHAAEAKQH